MTTKLIVLGYLIFYLVWAIVGLKGFHTFKPHSNKWIVSYTICLTSCFMVIVFVTAFVGVLIGDAL